MGIKIKVLEHVPTNGENIYAYIEGCPDDYAEAYECGMLGIGKTEEEALVDLARGRIIKLWNEETP